MLFTQILLDSWQNCDRMNCNTLKRRVIYGSFQREAGGGSALKLMYMKTTSEWPQSGPSITL